MLLYNRLCLILLLSVTFLFSCGDDVYEEVPTVPTNPVNPETKTNVENQTNSTEQTNPTIKSNQLNPGNSTDQIDSKKLVAEKNTTQLEQDKNLPATTKTINSTPVVSNTFKDAVKIKDENIFDFYSQKKSFNIKIESGIVSSAPLKTSSIPFSIRASDSSGIHFNTGFYQGDQVNSSTKLLKTKDIDQWTSWIQFIQKYPELFTQTTSTTVINNTTYETITFYDIPITSILLFMNSFYFPDNSFSSISENQIQNSVLSGTISDKLVFEYILTDVLNRKKAYSSSSIEQKYLLRQNEHLQTCIANQKVLAGYINSLNEKSNNITKDKITKIQNTLNPKATQVALAIRECLAIKEDELRKAKIVKQNNSKQGIHKIADMAAAALSSELNTNKNEHQHVDADPELVKKIIDPTYNLDQYLPEFFNVTQEVLSEGNISFSSSDLRLETSNPQSQDPSINVEQILSKISNDELNKYRSSIEQSDSVKNIDAYGLPYKTTVKILKGSLVPIEMSIKSTYSSEHSPKLKISLN